MLSILLISKITDQLWIEKEDNSNVTEILSSFISVKFS